MAKAVRQRGLGTMAGNMPVTSLLIAPALLVEQLCELDPPMRI